MGKRRPSISKSAQAGLTFPVGRIKRHFKQGRYAARVAQGAAIFTGEIMDPFLISFLLLSRVATTSTSDIIQRIPSILISPLSLRLCLPLPLIETSPLIADIYPRHKLSSPLLEYDSPADSSLPSSSSFATLTIPSPSSPVPKSWNSPETPVETVGPLAPIHVLSQPFPFNQTNRGGPLPDSPHFALLVHARSLLSPTPAHASLTDNRSRITPRHITLAVKNDEELTRLFDNCVISQGGVLPHIQPALLVFKTPSKKKATPEKAKTASEKQKEKD
ncbi:histone H2A, partial [Tremellales sp. Uapishka_1]